MIENFFNPSKNHFINSTNIQNKNREVRLEDYRKCNKFIVNFVDKLINVNEEQYTNFR